MIPRALTAKYSKGALLWKSFVWYGPTRHNGRIKSLGDFTVLSSHM